MDQSRRSFLKLFGAGAGATLVLPFPSVFKALWGFLSRPRRFLPCEWTVGPVNQLAAYHSIDVEQELAAHFADAMRFEIDREVMDNLHNAHYARLGDPVHIWLEETYVH